MFKGLKLFRKLSPPSPPEHEEYCEYVRTNGDHYCTCGAVNSYERELNIYKRIHKHSWQRLFYRCDGSGENFECNYPRNCPGCYACANEFDEYGDLYQNTMPWTLKKEINSHVGALRFKLDKLNLQGKFKDFYMLTWEDIKDRELTPATATCLLLLVALGPLATAWVLGFFSEALPTMYTHGANSALYIL